MAGKDSDPKDPREGRRPKDSEFYQIPPDLKKEFDMIMSERSTGGPSVEKIGRVLKARKRLGIASLIFGVLGGALIVVGPILAVVLGLMSMRTGKGIGGMPTAGREPAKFGIILGVLMFLVNIVTVIIWAGR